MQNADDNDPLSYFQVAGESSQYVNELNLMLIGIHGRPYRPWNNINQVQGAGPGTRAFGGYCTHSKLQHKALLNEMLI